ncbi:MAG TPA: sensor histidine kinase [Catalimonadaceae bacterium]|nr:sensor histidine kinase [Catalimonadaceae bacterium]
MKYWIVSWFCILFYHSALAQSPLETAEGKALWKSIRSGKSDTTQVYRYLDYGFLWEAYNLDSAGKWYNKVNELSKEVEFPLGEIKYRTNYTYLLNLDGNFKESVRLNHEALAIAKAHPELKYEGKCLANLGLSYIMDDQFDKGIPFLLQAKQWFEKEGDERNMLSIQIKIANTNLNAGYQQKGYEEIKKVLPLVESRKDTALLETALEVYSLACFNLNRAKEGLPVAERQLVLAAGKTLTVERVMVLVRLSGFYNDLNEPLKAIPFAKQAYQFGKESNNTRLVIKAAYRLMRANLKAKIYADARQFALEILELSKDQKAALEVLYSYETLYLVEAANKDFEKALTYHISYVDMVDSMHKQQIDSKLLDLETRFETSRKEKQILLLEKEKDRQKAIIIGLISGVLVVIGAGFLIYRNISIRRKIAESEVIQLQKERQLIATNSLLKGQDEERSRLARDLHDGLGGMLSGLKFSLNNMKGTMILEEKNAEAFSSSINQLDGVITELRRVAHSMMPEALVRFGLKEASQDLCDQMAKTSGLNIHFQAIGFDVELGQSVSLALYRIEQELLNNILKHAEATEITVQLVKDERQISLTVEDNGKGFDPSFIQTGAGLTSIKTRVEALGGRLDIQSKPGEGTSIVVEVNT